jgi:hypothetical protein
MIVLDDIPHRYKAAIVGEAALVSDGPGGFSL